MGGQTVRVYASFATMFTLDPKNPGDFASQLATIAEFSSGCLVLIGAIPLVVSRIATWDNELPTFRKRQRQPTPTDVPIDAVTAIIFYVAACFIGWITRT
jgi:hypothetical protein